MNIFITVPVGVGHQSPVGVFLTEEEALSAANECWKRSDGYHSFEIQEREVGAVYDSYTRESSLSDLTTKPLQVARVFESDVPRLEV